MQTIIVTVNQQGEKTALQIDDKVIATITKDSSTKGVIVVLSELLAAAITAVTLMLWNLYRGA